MKLVSFKKAGVVKVGVVVGDEVVDLQAAGAHLPGTLVEVLTHIDQNGPRAIQEVVDAAGSGQRTALKDLSLVTPVPQPGKVLCLGANYEAHAREGGIAKPDYPIIFLRTNSSLVAHGEPLVATSVSEQFDYEAELAVVIGRAAKNVSKEEALDYVGGYSLFNDATVRDYQLRTTQWTVGKNFDGTGAFGPVVVTADELPAGGAGLRIQTILNGVVVQDGSTSEMIFDVADTISLLSQTMTLEPGDVLITGTPAGVGMARTPPLWLKAGDTCEIRIEGIGSLVNPVVADAA